MKVKLSFVHKAVILSLSKLNIESKSFFQKSCSVWYAILECHIKSESSAVIWSQSSHIKGFEGIFKDSTGLQQNCSNYKIFELILIGFKKFLWLSKDFKRV